MDNPFIFSGIMNDMKKIVWIIIIMIVLGLLGFYFLNSSDYSRDNVFEPPPPLPGN
ncbi:MAG: hypothetical protein AAB415_01820 [Patescibacteria group bacterium]